MPDDLITIRSSALPIWNDCPRRSAARLIRADIEASGIRLAAESRSIGAIIGTATHAAAAWTLGERMANGGMGSEGAATDIAIQSIRADVQQTETPVVWDDRTQNIKGAEQAVVRQVAQYRKDVAAKVEPVLVEYQMQADWGPIRLTGKIDLVEAMAGGDRGLRDIKGGRTRPNAAQYGSYSLLLKANGQEVSRIIEDGIPRVHGARPQPPVISRQIDRALAEVMAKEALAVIHGQLAAWKAKRLPTAFPANPNSALCSKKYCSAWGTAWCNAWRLKE